MSMQTMSLDRYEIPSLSNVHSSSSSRSRSRSARTTNAVASHSSSTIMREQTSETSLSVLIWHPATSASSSGSALSKAQILRDVPQVKLKLGRRDRDSMPGPPFFDTSSTPNNSSSIALSDPRSFVNLKNATPSWLREKPSKAKLTSGSASQQKAGIWKKATLTVRETGALLILGDDRAMLHSISASELSANDIRLVDDSLFARPYVLGIFARPSTLTAGVRSPTGQKAVSPTTPVSSIGKVKEDPIYLCFPTSQKLYSWRSLLRVFAKPEIYGPSNGSVPSGTHRSYRQVDMTIHEIRLFADRALPHSSLMANADRGRRTSGVASPPPPEQHDAHTAAPLVSSNSEVTSPSFNANAQRRTSFESSGRALGSMLERITTRDTHFAMEGKHQQQDDNLDDTKSSISADDIANASGPIAGPSTSRTIDAMSSFAATAVDMDRRGSDGSSHNVQQSQNVQPSSCFCQIYLDGDVVARTKVCSGTSNIAWFDKFSLQDLPHVGSLHIEVLQAWRPTKFVILGYTDLPVETMRRGETVEGWYPVWALPRLDDVWSRRDDRSASYTREMVGELKVALNVFDETILPSTKYSDINATLNGEGCVDLARRLCKELEEDRIVSHLVDIYTSGGTIVERLADLTRAESAGFSMEPTLLFRGNTLLSRAIDKYQRRYCSDWLEACVGPTVRKVCAERIKLEPGEASPVLPPSHLGSTGHSTSSSGQDDASLEMLKALSEDLWSTIYAHRHKCPSDLRRALAVIRRTVNAHYNSVQGPGVQGVGAFVFLRLICPAITSPNLYGLMGAAPDPSSAKTLMLLAKVFLALANKRQSFDKDKEPWLIKLNEFLRQHASAYDDFITIISSEPDDMAKMKPLGDEKDFGFQRLTQQRVDSLLPLHRESIPHYGLKLDHAQAMASLVSYVVRGASVDPYDDHVGGLTGDSALGHRENTTTGHSSSSDSELVNDFVDMCCDIEDVVGYHLDRAGYRPEPIQSFSRSALGGVFKTTSIFTASKGSPLTNNGASSAAGVGGRSSPTKGSSVGRIGVGGAGPSLYSASSLQATDSILSSRGRRATVSGEGRMDTSDDGGHTSSTYQPKMSYIGQDSFLRSQLPSKFNVDEQPNVITKSDSSQVCDQGISNDTQHSSVVNDFEGRGSGDLHRRRQSAFATSTGGPESRSGGAEFEWRSARNHDRNLLENSRRTDMSDDYSTPPPSFHVQQYGTRLRSDTIGGVEEAKKKRGWWRRLK